MWYPEWRPSWIPFGSVFSGSPAHTPPFPVSSAQRSAGQWIVRHGFRVRSLAHLALCGSWESCSPLSYPWRDI